MHKYRVIAELKIKMAVTITCGDEKEARAIGAYRSAAEWLMEGDPVDERVESVEVSELPESMH